MLLVTVCINLLHLGTVQPASYSQSRHVAVSLPFGHEFWAILQLPLQTPRVVLVHSLALTPTLVGSRFDHGWEIQRLG